MIENHWLVYAGFRVSNSCVKMKVETLCSAGGGWVGCGAAGDAPAGGCVGDGVAPVQPASMRLATVTPNSRNFRIFVRGMGFSSPMFDELNSDGLRCGATHRSLKVSVGLSSPPGYVRGLIGPCKR